MKTTTTYTSDDGIVFSSKKESRSRDSHTRRIEIANRLFMKGKSLAESLHATWYPYMIPKKFYKITKNSKFMFANGSIYEPYPQGHMIVSNYPNNIERGDDGEHVFEKNKWNTWELQVWGDIGDWGMDITSMSFSAAAKRLQ